MQIIENSKVKEKMYIEKLENGLTVIVFPKSHTKKKTAIFATNFGSIDNTFLDPNNAEQVIIPDGVAHFLEHKLFEQENGTNSLDALSSLGTEPNAYTTTDHTAYFFECTNNFYEALDELMDYVQNPYFTDENVEKEKGIIGQEIMMYEDFPEWKVYINALTLLYKDNPVRIDTLGTKETISKIDKEILYKAYNIFYNPSNMIFVVCGDFVPEEIIEEIKNRLVDKPNQASINRIYPDEPENINQNFKQEEMDVSNSLFIIGIKDKPVEEQEVIKRHIAVDVLLTMALGHSSKLYKRLYEEGYIFARPELDYEISKQYSHILISGMSKDPEFVYEEFKDMVRNMKQEGLEKEYFERIKRKIYGNYAMEYNSVGSIAKMIVYDYFRGINSFDYLEEYNRITIEYCEQILKELFQEEKMILSIVKAK